MDPFYDENFYYDNYNPQTYPPFPINNKMKARITLQRSLHYATKTIYTINQIIPLIYQIRPIINNTKNAFKSISLIWFTAWMILNAFLLHYDMYLFHIY